MTATSVVMDKKFAGLKRFNLIMGFLHLIQGVFMIVVDNDTTYPIYTNYLNFDPTIFSLSPNPQLLYEVPFGPAVAMFLLISAVAHFYLSTIGYERYVDNLKKGMNPVRFYEYAFSSSLMIVLIWPILLKVIMTGPKISAKYCKNEATPQSFSILRRKCRTSVTR